MTSPQPLIAWDIHGNSDFPIEVAPVARDWMDESEGRFAYRCLPLVIANQSGWLIRCPFGFTAKWNGESGTKAIRLWYHDRKKDVRVTSHFGQGVVTFAVPYLFQTPSDVNLWVKGPANMIKDGVQPLEAIIESDWIESSFTMNWKFTRPDFAVRFEKGDPFCMVIPVQRGLAESFEPQIQNLQSDVDRHQRYTRWQDSRAAFNAALTAGDPDAAKKGWQRHYMQGKDVDGKPHPQHQTRLSLQPFRRVDCNGKSVD